MIAKHVLSAVHEIGLMAGISIIWTANVSGQVIQPLIGTPLPNPPQVVSPFELRAINDPATGICALPLWSTTEHSATSARTRISGTRSGTDTSLA
jgi:hypothetical protein